VLGISGWAGVRGLPARFRPSHVSLPEAETLGIIFALALMASSVFVCLSRGGMLALAASSLLGLALWVFRFRRSAQTGVLLLAPAVVLALVFWFGFDRVTTRLEDLRRDEVLKDSRMAIWSHAVPLVQDFFLWGTGFGTYRYVEMMHRDDADQVDLIIDHAHNDFLEVLVEAGLFGLVVSVLAIALLFRHGLRAVRGDQGEPAALTLGALIGLAAISFHSFSDFSLHMPANAVLATVLCAQLCVRGQEQVRSRPIASADRAVSLQGRGMRLIRRLSPVLGAVLVLALGLGLVDQGWRKACARQLEQQSFDEDRSNEQGRNDRKVAHFEAAARLTPADAGLQAELAYAHLNALAEKRWAISTPDLAPPGLSPAHPGPEPKPEPAAIERLKRMHMVPALRAFLRSRDLCPVRAMAHLDIANVVADFHSAEPQAAYLERAERLAPGDPWLWYQCGITALAGGRPREAWAAWRHSLELSNQHLQEILDRSRTQLDARGVLGSVLPDQPERLLEAAGALGPQQDEGRRRILDRALAVLERTPGTHSAKALYTRATIQRALDQPTAALKAYRKALLLEPGQSRWRYELAELSYSQGQYDEAHQELLTILALEPKNAQARKLLDAVARGLAEGR
jgi:tetratricopeptide (TPR) repeat protein